MKKLILILTVSLSFNALSLENCIDFPVIGNVEKVFKGKISQTSEAVFENCPDSVLVNDQMVARLSQVLEYKGKRSCLYSRGVGSVLFLCEQK
jgi:hypothetical protein